MVSLILEIPGLVKPQNIGVGSFQMADVKPFLAFDIVNLELATNQLRLLHLGGYVRGVQVQPWGNLSVEVPQHLCASLHPRDRRDAQGAVLWGQRWAPSLPLALHRRPRGLLYRRGRHQFLTRTSTRRISGVRVGGRFPVRMQPRV